MKIIICILSFTVGFLLAVVINLYKQQKKYKDKEFH